MPKISKRAFQALIRFSHKRLALGFSEIPDVGAGLRIKYYHEPESTGNDKYYIRES
jgi:hypothetical protein